MDIILSKCRTVFTRRSSTSIIQIDVERHQLITAFKIYYSVTSRGDRGLPERRRRLLANAVDVE